MSDMRTAVQNINTTVTRLNQDALSASNMQNLKASIDHLNATTGRSLTLPRNWMA